MGAGRSVAANVSVHAGSIAVGRGSAFSRFSRRISSDSDDVAPDRSPASTCAFRNHLRTDSADVTPNSAAIRCIVAYSVSSSGRSATIRTARAFNLVGYRLMCSLP